MSGEAVAAVRERLEQMLIELDGARELLEKFPATCRRDAILAALLGAQDRLAEACASAAGGEA